MPFSITDFAARLASGGARPTLFEVNIFNPIVRDADNQVPLFVRSAQIPESVVGTIEVPYFGRRVKVPGDRQFAEWTVQVINDENFSVRDRLERWSAAIAGHQTNLRATDDIQTLKSSALVTQFSKAGEKLRTYEFVGLFPTMIGPIDLDWENNDTIEVFQVTFQYDFWTVKSGSTRTSSMA